MIPPRLLKFCLVGASGVVTNTAVLFGLKEFVHFPLFLASILAVECAIITNFLLNDNYTFAADIQDDLPYYRFAKFNIVCAFGMAANVLTLVVLTSAGLYYLIANLVGVLVAVGINYGGSCKFIWDGEKKD
jgi:putative flippase GtrA